MLLDIEWVSVFVLNFEFFNEGDFVYVIGLWLIDLMLFNVEILGVVFIVFVGWIVVEGYELVEFVNDLEERKSFY